MMTILTIKRYLTAILMFISISVFASALTELPVKTVNGKKYHYYVVKQHETVYALSKRFGITPEQLIKYNPSAEDGLQIDQELLFPATEIKDAAEMKAAQNSGHAGDTYTVKKQETAYGVSKRFGLSLEEFYELNPETRDGIQEGQTVIIKKNGKKPRIESPATPVAPAKKGNTHIIQEHETLYQIARDNNIRLSELLEANPGLDAARYSAGQEINIPRHAAETPINSQTATDQSGNIKDNGTIDSNNKVTIAVALPFNLDKKDKHNKPMVEFYRGFLLAIDSMRNSGAPIHLMTFDTESTQDGVEQIIDMPDLKNVNAIIAPDNSEALKAFNSFGLENHIAVINPFNNRDSSYVNNPYAMQMALPRDMMYDRAAKAFLDSFEDYVPVILVSNGGRKDKMEFIDLLKAHLNKTGRKFKEIGYSGPLTAEILTRNLSRSENYAFIPASSHKDEFDNISGALETYKDSRDFKNEIIVWGYPEWLANRGGYEKMHNLDSYIYSRTDLPESFSTADIDAAYTKWFGPNMITTYPRWFYMGFDLGTFLLKSLKANGGDFSRNTYYYSGVFMPVMMRRHGDNGGFFNNELLLINLAPGETISKRTI